MCTLGRWAGGKVPLSGLPKSVEMVSGHTWKQGAWRRQMRPSPTGSPNLPVTEYLAHLSLSCVLQESSWYLREREVCGQLWDFSVPIHRSPPGHLLLRLLGSSPWKGADSASEGRPFTSLTGLALSQTLSWCQKLPPQAP